MLYASSLISFHHCVSILKFVSSSIHLATAFVSGIFIYFIMCEPGEKKKTVRNTRSLEKPGGQKTRTLSPIGSASHLTLAPNEIFTWMDSVKQRWGDVVKFRAFGRSKVFINSYDAATQLLSKETSLLKSKEFILLQPVVGHSLAGVSSELHLQSRKMLEAGFSGQVVKNPLEIFCRYARKFRDSLMVHVESEKIFNVMEYTDLYAYRISCETALGHDIVQDIWNVDCNEQITAWKTLVTHFDYQSSQSQQPSQKSDLIIKRSPKNNEIDHCLGKINNFMEGNIFKRRQHREFLKANRFYEDEGTTMKTEMQPECFADFLLDLEDKNELTKQEVLHNLNIYTVAGFDAIGITLARILQFLINHPKVQEKCVEEITHILHNNGKNANKANSLPSSFVSNPSSPRQKSSPSFDTFPTIFSLIFATGDLHITYEHLQQMKYLECCIKETLRLIPVLPWLLRRTHKDIQLADKSVISPNVDVLINTCFINRDPKHFPEPEMFKPERHSSEATVQDSFYMSFGAGPKICPGMMFAVQQLKVMLVHLLLAFKWESGTREKENGKNTECNNVNNNDISVDNDVKKTCLFHNSVSIPDNKCNVKISRRM